MLSLDKLKLLSNNIINLFKDMFGEDSVPKTFTGDRFEVVVDQKLAKIDLSSQNVTCEDDEVNTQYSGDQNFDH